jgi:hypothetical protein
MTITDEQALAAVQRAMQEHGPELGMDWVRKRAVLYLWQQHRGTKLADLRDHVDRAIARVNDRRDAKANLAKYLVEHGRTPAPYWKYQFPNGYTASVTVDLHPQRPFSFELLTDATTGADGRGLTAGLTSDQVVDQLTAIAGLPAPEPGEEKPTDITPSLLPGAPPVRTYADGSQTYGPYA